MAWPGGGVTMLGWNRDRSPELRLAFQLSMILWLASSTVVTLGAIFFGQMHTVSAYLIVPITVCTAAAITTLLFGPVRLLQNRRAIVAVPAIIVTIALAATLQTAADYGTQALFVPIFPGHVMPDTNPKLLLITWTIYFALYTCNAALLWLSFVAHLSKTREIALTQTKLDLAIADARSAQAELKMLRLQLDPHFMVNSLSAISTLAITNDERAAAEMADSLADFLRFSLEQSDGAEQPLTDEIALTTAYLSVEKIRFGDRIRVELDCPQELGQALIPNFILQPLVENAMKHGFNSAVGEMSLRIAARAVDGHLILTVDDHAQERRTVPAAQGLGIGLTNTRERLETLYGADAALITTALKDGFRSEIRLPVKFAIHDSQDACARELA
jgi:two-component system LytT family sensor kinase